jgi:chromosome segregation ATPase
MILSEEQDKLKAQIADLQRELDTGKEKVQELDATCERLAEMERVCQELREKTADSKKKFRDGKNGP